MRPRSTLALLVLASLAAVVPSPSRAQSAQSAQSAPTLYAVVHCMQSTAPDYEAVETEIWKPMHEEAVQRGLLTGWAFYSVSFGDRSACDYYTVTQYLGAAQLNADDQYRDIFAAVHPGQDWDAMWARTYGARRALRAELWTWIDGVPVQEFTNLQVNLMAAANGAAYTAMESELWKPVHQALQTAGHTAGWAVWQLYSPGGSQVPYNFMTVDVLKGIRPAPVDETFAAVHAGKDVDALWARTDTVRTMVSIETWRLIAATESR